jgi:hypothetical protein
MGGGVMRDEKTFIDYLMAFYGKQGLEKHYEMTREDAIKYTKIYKDLFPNLWGGGDSLDREKVATLYVMGRADALAKKHNEEEVA